MNNINNFGFGCDYLAILDVLTDEDLQTGRRIDENINDAINEYNSNFQCQRFECKNSEGFFNTLRIIKEQLIQNDLVPCIHIEGHGSKENLQMADGTLIEWKFIFSLFREINIECKNNLFFSSGACNSAYGYSSVSIKNATQVFGLLAPEEKVEAGELADAFSIFYKTLINKGDLNISAEAFLANVSNGKQYAFIYSPTLFRTAMENYLKEFCIGEGKRDRLDALLTEVNNIEALSTSEKRKALKKQLYADQAPVMERFHNTFMMIDLYPENAERFNFNAEEFENSIRKLAIIKA